jgi:hypothetical protein
MEQEAGSRGMERLRAAMARNDKWIVALCSRKISAQLYKFSKSKSNEEMNLPKQAFAVIPISEVFDRASNSWPHCKYHRDH